LRQRVVLEKTDGTRMDMIADSYFIQLLSDFEKAVLHGDDYIDSVSTGLGRHPRYVKAFEHMLEEEAEPFRRRLIERILLEYEFISAFQLMDTEEEGF